MQGDKAERGRMYQVGKHQEDRDSILWWRHPGGELQGQEGRAERPTGRWGWGPSGPLHWVQVKGKCLGGPS